MAQIKILVAENDPDFQESFVKDVLEPEGYRVLQAGSPEEAKQALKGEKLIHLAILDIRLTDESPSDRSGLELGEEINPFVAKIVLTAYPEDWKLVREILRPMEGKRRVADGFFGKLEDQKLVLDEIKRVLREKFEIIPKRRIAVLTSGGDSPGMNAAIWAITRIAMNNSVEVIGIEDGYLGLSKNLMHKLTWDEVSDIMVQGGTILGTARFDDFKEKDGRKDAIENIRHNQISGLIVIGGDGSMRGAKKLVEDLEELDWKLQTIAIPGTIDNDLWGTDMSLGAASAANAMIEELRNMIRPAQALRRIFVCEMMGRYCGYLALQAALGIGADAVIIPEQVIEVTSPHDEDSSTWIDRLNVNKTNEQVSIRLKEAANLLEKTFAAGKKYGFVVLGEGIKLLIKDRLNARKYLEDEIKRWSSTFKHPDVREHILGYPVRGGPPCRFDIWLGARLGAEAVQGILGGKTKVMVGWSEEDGIVETPIDEVVDKSKRSPQEIWKDRPKWQELLEMQEALACPPSLRQQLKDRGNRFVR
ncbi:MAG: ATP-dependent 6-phosphofructokinase [Proteobacteria bacterium]|nr:ATP-dependent 6-phosphofructokinase [Pseudomonadota bacterium]